MNKLLLALVVTMALFSSANAECDLTASEKCLTDAATSATDACATLATKAKCNNGAGCWPDYTILGTKFDNKEFCLDAALLAKCNATTCDSGSMATPMVSLFAVIAAMLYKLM